MKKERVDKLLHERGLAPSRERARALVMAGKVFTGDSRIDKPGQLIALGAPLTIKEPIPYVSRGGIKLEKAIREFGLSISGKSVLDVGASTGGFTDCLLQHGAGQVYAVDVGYGQMDPRIAHHPRVVLRDRVNIRYVSPSDFPVLFDLITIDVSFISLRLVLPVVKKLLAEPGGIIALVKPQFEVGKGQVGKGGIVRDPEKHIRVLKEIIDFAQEHSLALAGLTLSPIAGSRGNREFLLYLIHPGENASPAAIDRAIGQSVLLLQN
ncbi:MAG: TlyA family RNA methyltransferase [bacterium]